MALRWSTVNMMSSLRGTRDLAWPSAGAWILAGVVMACQVPPSTPIISPQVAEPTTPSQPLAVVEAPPPQQAKPSARKSAGKRLGPPKIKLARLIGPRTVELVFTEAMGPTDQFDPNAFRLSMGMDYRYARYAYAYYYDAGEAFSDKRGNFVAAHRIADDVLQLELEADLDEELCPELREMRREIKLEPGVRGSAGLYLHYAPPAQGALSDREGEKMAGFGVPFAKDRNKDELEFEGKAARKALAKLQRVACKWK